MATLSFLRLSQGYSLVVGRQAEPESPRVQSIEQASVHGADEGAVRVLFPVAGPSGGTWVGVNHLGVAFALLGLEAVTDVAPAAPALSNVRLVPEALRARSAGGGLERVAAMDLSSTAPFQLLGVEEGQAPLSLRWDGRELQRRLHPDGALLLSTLSQPPPLALDVPGEAELLAAQEDYHRSLLAGGDGYTQVLVLPKLIALRYLDRHAFELGQEPEMVQMLRNFEP